VELSETFVMRRDPSGRRLKGNNDFKSEG
jgi:hypothetical protein